jgi:RNA polymerase sigma-70 factor (ECF subfamily)
VSAPELHTTQIQRLVERLQAGDVQAQNELLRRTGNRLEQLARSMLHRFPGVRRWEQTGDVLQNATLRLLRALERVRPESTRHFFNLAAEQIRRELLDLVRHYRRRHGPGANHANGGPADRIHAAANVSDLPDPADEAADLERWQAFHTAIGELPDQEREVFELVYYHGWTRVQIAALSQVDERTVRRRWRAACLRLGESLGGDFPSPCGDS